MTMIRSTLGVTILVALSGCGNSPSHDLGAAQSALNLDDEVDFDANGSPDLLWHNGTTGDTQIWYMNQIARVSTLNFSAALNVTDASNWRPVGINHFSVEAATSILWHNGVTGDSQIWYMNSTGSSRDSFANFDTSLRFTDSSGWKIVATRAFQVMRHNGTTGVTEIWDITQANPVTRSALTTLDSSLNVSDSSGWQIAGWYDFDQDGVADILWHNGTSGDTQLWYMSSATSRRSTLMFAPSVNVKDSSGWRIVQIGSLFDSGSAPDIVWHNGTSGATQVWYMGGAQGGTIIGSGDFSSSLNVADSTGWRVVSH